MARVWCAIILFHCSCAIIFRSLAQLAVRVNCLRYCTVYRNISQQGRTPVEKQILASHRIDRVRLPEQRRTAS